MAVVVQKLGDIERAIKSKTAVPRRTVGSIARPRDLQHCGWRATSRFSNVIRTSATVPITVTVRWAYRVGTEYAFVSNRTSDNESAPTSVTRRASKGLAGRGKNAARSSASSVATVPDFPRTDRSWSRRHASSNRAFNSSREDTLGTGTRKFDRA